MKLFVKNMTTPHAKREIKIILENFGLHVLSMDIGETEIREAIAAAEYFSLKEVLSEKGFDLVADRENILTEKIRNIIIEMVHFSDELPMMKYSNYISGKLRTNYTYLSKVFSRVRHVTIEHFIILHKIERVKQLLLHSELTLSEIALRLHYSSTAHLSAQFKKVTGLTPSIFKRSKFKTLPPLEYL